MRFKVECLLALQGLVFALRGLVFVSALKSSVCKCCFALEGLGFRGLGEGFRGWGLGKGLELQDVLDVQLQEHPAPKVARQ